MQDRSLPQFILDRLNNQEEPLLLPQLLEKHEYEGKSYSLAMWLIKKGNPFILRSLCCKAMNAEANEDKKAKYRLHYAVTGRFHEDELDKLIASSPSLLNAVYNGLTVLDCAVMEYDLAKVQYLLRKMKEAGFKCPCQHWCRRTSALHLAVSQLDGPIVNILLKGDFSCRLRDKNGNTPVHTLLSMRGEIDRVLPYMISHVRAQINIPNNANQTPFMLAAMNDRIELMKSCIEMDVKNGEKQIVHQDNINFTFQLALRKNKLEVANMLLPYVTGLRKEDSKQLKALLAGKQIDIKLPDFNALFFAPTSREPLSVDETIPLLPKRERVDYSDAIFRDSKASTWRVM